MAFPRGRLRPDESVADHLHPHWTTLVPAVATFLVTCAAVGVLVAVVPHGAVREPLLLVVLGLAAVVLTWWVLRPVLRWRTTHYLLTDQRLVLRTGVLRHTDREIPLVRVREVACERSLWDRLVGGGTVVVDVGDELGPQRLVDVPHADRVQRLLDDLVDELYRAPHR